MQTVFSKFVRANALEMTNSELMHAVLKVKLATLTKGEPKAPFSISTTPRCRGGRYFIPWIALIYP